MIQLAGVHTVHLEDAGGQQVGEIEIDRREDAVVFGRFAPGPAFGRMRHLFEAFEEAVEHQALSVVDRLDGEIAALGLRIRLPDAPESTEVRDVQIGNDGSVTFRLGSMPSPTEDADPVSGSPRQVESATT